MPRHALVLNSSHDLFTEKGRDLNIEKKNGRICDIILGTQLGNMNSLGSEDAAMCAQEI